MKLSIVASLYRSAPYIMEFHSRISLSAEKIAKDDYEIVFVNDGSPDESLDLAIELTRLDRKLKVVDLSRNFGHHKAMMTGLEYSSGEIVFLIDSDLEEEPECILDFYEKFKTDTCDVVYGVQEKRKGNYFEKFSGQWFYVFFKLLTGLSLPKNVVTARLMSRRYVNALLTHKEREVFLAGLWCITGFTQVPLQIRKLSSSETTYTFRKKMSLLVNSVTSFSNAPLVAIFYMGVLISSLTLIYIVYLSVNWMFLAKPPSGWTSVMASIWLIGGMIISFIGIVGIYLSKIFSETKQRPYTIVREIYGQRTN